MLLDIGDRTLTGNLSLAGDVIATGSNMNDFTKTATGTFQVRAEEGVLKKFSVLSKIFSLLNVSQLLKFQLPDMAKDGMPYTVDHSRPVSQRRRFILGRFPHPQRRHADFRCGKS